MADCWQDVRVHARLATLDRAGRLAAALVGGVLGGERLDGARRSHLRAGRCRLLVVERLCRPGEDLARLGLGVGSSQTGFQGWPSPAGP
jgi:hypothetical protein